MARTFHNPHEDHAVPATTAKTKAETIRKASLQLAGRARNRAELERWLDMLGLPLRLRDRYLYGKGRTSS